MPVATRESNQFSITIRTGEADGVRKYERDYIQWLDTVGTSHYAVAYEQKGDLSTQHFQCAVVFTEDHRSDNLKKTLVGLLGDGWTADQKKRAVCVNKNREGNDIKLLAGGYCMKQDDQPILKGWTLEELEPYVFQYEELKNKSLLRNISRENITGLLQQWYDDVAYHKDPDVRDRFERKSNRQKLDFVYQYGISQGADLQKYSTPVWKCYFTDNFNVIFDRLSADNLLKILSDTPV